MSDDMVYGIDLGTTYSAIARLDQYGKPEAIENSDGQYTTPSVVLFEEGSERYVVGLEAKNESAINPDRVVQWVKRFMGIEGWTTEIDGREWTPEEVSAIILKRLASDAAAKIGSPVENVVITVPAYFDDVARTATRTAGKIAGLNVIEVLNEPTAAALYYSVMSPDADLTGDILVYDLGGGTFDVTVITVSGDAVTVIATGGRRELGGKDWDDRLVTYVAEQFNLVHGIDPLDDPIALQELRIRAEEAKRSLSSRDAVRVAVSAGGARDSVEVTREKFDEITLDLLQNTIQLTNELLEKATEKGHSSLSEILLVGGSSKMPQVEEAVKQALGSQPRLFEPDMAVAKGAALWAAKRWVDQKVIDELGSDASEQEVEEVTQRFAAEVGLPAALVVKRVGDVLSHSVGVVVEDQNRPGVMVVSRLLAAQTPIDQATASGEFGTSADGQTDVRITIVQGEDDDPTQCTQVGEGTLSWGVPVPRNSPIEITFSMSGEGIIVVTGMDKTYGNATTFELERVSAMSADEIQAATNVVSALRARGE